MRKLASIQEVLDISPIDGADRIEVVTILGWKVVTRKGEFEVGDKCIYFEVDSLIPIREWNKFLEDKNKPGHPIRIKTIRLRGQLSQGLAIPVKILEEYVGEEYKTYEIGRDVTEILNIEKYEIQIPARLSGQVRGVFPSLVPKTDESRIQSYPELLEEFRGKGYVMTLKCDGTSGTFMNMDGDHHVCSRNLSLKDDGVNTYWEMYNKYEMKSKLEDMGNFAIQGEVCGPGVQKNRLGLKERQLLVFDIYDIKEGRRVGVEKMLELCSKYELTTVPIDSKGEFGFRTIEELIEYANSRRYPSNDKLAEGIVVRPIEEFYSITLSGRASFKVISNAFLEEYGL